MDNQKNTPEISELPPPWDPELEFTALEVQHAGDGSERPQAEAISVSSVWQMDSPQAADDALAGKASSSGKEGTSAFVYRRDGHPNDRNLAGKLAKLHAAEAACVTAQGMSAFAAIALSCLKPGAKVWIGDELYGKTSKLFLSDMQHWGVQVHLFDTCSKEDLERLASNEVDLVIAETITNPRIRVPDLSELARVTHKAGGRLVIDNTFATHLIARPLVFGADFVIESLSKQVNGHSDSMLGLVCGSDAKAMQPVSDAIKTFGLASSPLDCFLTHRGLLSLGLRVERACKNALALARALETLHVIRVDYPGLTTHPQHELAKRQFQGGYGWMLTINLDIDRKTVDEIFQRLKPEIQFVPSLGDASTTISHPCTTSHRGYSHEQRNALGIGEGTIRISCGVEPTEQLVEKFISVLRDFC